MTIQDTTPQGIHRYKLQWLPGFQVVVHSDLSSQCTEWCKLNAQQWEWKQIKYTHVYAHTYCFEHEYMANKFTQAFNDWVNKGIT